MLFAEIRSDYYWDFGDFGIVVKDENKNIIKEFKYDNGVTNKKTVERAVDLAEAYIAGLVAGK